MIGRHSAEPLGGFYGIHYGLGGYLGRGCAQGIKVRPFGPNRKGKNDIAIELGMDRANGAGHPILCHLRDLGCLKFVKLRISNYYYYCSIFYT